MVAIRLLDAHALTSLDGALCELLIDAVDGGASVGFLAPLARAEAASFWQGVRQSASRAERVVLGAFDGDALVGSVQLVFGALPNQRHRADVAKLLVLRSARRRGVARSLMEALEREAVRAGRTLLTLDTRTGDAADSLYPAMGYRSIGVIPRYALYNGGATVDTTVYYKDLAPPPPAALWPALVLIDLQRGIDDPRWGLRNNPRAESNAARLLAAFRRRGAPVFHVRHDSREPASTYRPHQPGHDFKPEVAPLAGEAVIAKSTPSALLRTELEARLHALGVTELVLCGVKTNNSVEATARMAGGLGFAAQVVADACFTFGQRDWNGLPRTADEVHAMALANLSGEYAAVVSTDELLRLY